MAFSANVNAALDWRWDDGALYKSQLGYAKRFQVGGGTGQAQAAWDDTRSLADGETVVLELTALTRDVLEDTLTTTLLTVKALLITTSEESLGILTVGDSIQDAYYVEQWSAPFGADGDTIELPPGGVLLLVAAGDGWPVDLENRLLKLAASGGNVSYSIALIGTLTAPDSGSSSEEGGSGA